MLMFVRSFVCSMKTCLELSIFIFLSQVSLRSVSGQSQSQVSLRSLSGQSEVSQVSLRCLCAYFVRQTEPKILRLVKTEMFSASKKILFKY